MAERDLVATFRDARSDPGLVVLEGFHPLKHALRFGAEITLAVSSNPAAAQELAARLAPELTPWLRDRLIEVPPSLFAALAPAPPPTGLLALARRPPLPLERLWQSNSPAPLVLLEAPGDLGNIGAVVRVAAAAAAAAVLTTGRHDPWHPAAVRGGAGLQFALPVGRVERLPATSRALLALHPDGQRLTPAAIPPGAVLAFGTERHGLSPSLLARADARISIPMRPGISSLNLATAVAVALYTWRLAQPQG